MVLTINNVDMIPYIAHGGIKWQRNDIDAPNSGRTMNGDLMRGRITTKIRLDITCRPLTKEELSIVLNAVYPQYVTVTYDDPMYGRSIKTMYSNNNPATFMMIDERGIETWNGVTFPLIER